MQNTFQYHALGIGSPLLDFLVYVDDAFLARVELEKGRMHPISAEESRRYLAELKEHEVHTVPGGSSANTLAGIAALGGRAAFLGKIGNDEHGALYEELTADDDVRTFLSRHDYARTGHAFTFVTPEGERTFATHLGAAVEFCAEDILPEEIAKSAFLHLEGYQLEGLSTRDALAGALAAARASHTNISLDLSDAGMVERAREALDEILHDRVTIIFVNETEAMAYARGKAEDALALLGAYADIVVLKKGEQGSILFSGGEYSDIAPCKAEVIDTTGAGDAYAAGMLWALAEGHSLMLAGKIGSICGAAVVSQKGARLKKDIRTKIKSLLKI